MQFAPPLLDDIVVVAGVRGVCRNNQAAQVRCGHPDNQIAVIKCYNLQVVLLEIDRLWVPRSLVLGSSIGPSGYSTHLYLQNFLTCTSYSLAPPLLTCASELLTCASDLLTCASTSFSLTPHYFPTCACSTILLLIENVYSLSFHNAMILNLACYLNFLPPCFPQCHHL